MERTPTTNQPTTNRQSPIANRQSPIANRQINRQINRQSPIANRQINRQSPIAKSIANPQINRQSPNQSPIAKSIANRQSPGVWLLCAVCCVVRGVHSYERCMTLHSYSMLPAATIRHRVHGIVRGIPASCSLPVGGRMPSLQHQSTITERHRDTEH